MMETARTSETSVDIQLRTRPYIPEDSELHTRRRENLKSHRFVIVESNEVLQLFRELLFNKLFYQWASHCRRLSAETTGW
jgi:hypothetical protein